MVLYIVLKFGYYDICDFILKNNDFKKYVCEKFLEGKNVCYYVVEFGFVRLFWLLVDNGIDVKEVIEKELNIFYIVCIYNWLEMGKFIFDNFNDFVVVKSNDDWIVVLYVVKNGNMEFLKFLFENEVGFDYKFESDRNVLYIVCDNGYLELCIFLMDNCFFLLLVFDEKGRYFVYFVVRSGNMELLKYFEIICKIELMKEISIGMNIFYMVCLYDYIEMCEYILDRYLNFNVKCIENGWIIVYYVVGRGNNKGNEIEIFEMFINDENWVEIKYFSKYGNLVLILVIKYNVFEFVEYFFKNYWDMLNILDVNNLWEIGNEYLKMLEFLYKYLDKFF